jgi:hydroxymethylpyrimidine pyrophosphatase-like HAD family hydrolase/DNA-binding response OmpR family regulator
MIGKKILIVEDEIGVVRPLQRALSTDNENAYLVETCITAEAALSRLNTQSFDLLITDLRLPGMDGMKLLKEAWRLNPAMRTLLITAFGNPDMEEEARRMGTVYLPKPFHLRDLVRIVRRLLSEPRGREFIPQTESIDEHTDSESPENPLTGFEKRRATHFKVLASDLDGTLVHEYDSQDQPRIRPKTWNALRRIKAAGITLMLVTGRTLESFVNSGHFLEVFEVIIAEDGAVVYFPRRETVKLPFGRLPAAVVQRLEEMNIPLERGMSIIATRVPHDQAILQVLQELNIGATIEYNRGAVMLLPPGATKGTGLTYALYELGFSARNVIACGDAENDRSMFEMAELAIAVPNALPKIKAAADAVLTLSDGDTGVGIEVLINKLLTRRGPEYRRRHERRLVLGYAHDESPVYLDPLMLVDSRMGIFGASSTGKSWLAGLVTEGLFKLGYQVCIIDPEGDYRLLGLSTQSLVLGGTSAPLPSVADVVNFGEWHGVSLVLDLSMHAHEERRIFLIDLLRAMRGLRVRRGRPHWLLIDEIQSFCPPDDDEITSLLLESMHEGMGCGVVSYRPSQVSPALLDALDHWLLTRINLAEEQQAIARAMKKYQDMDAIIPQLRELPLGQAYLCSNEFRPITSRLESPVRFRTGIRTIPHIRHLHKYLRAPLPPEKRFYFCNERKKRLGYSAANLWEFRDSLGNLPVGSLHYHMNNGDFAIWLEEVLHDAELARCVNKVSHRELKGDELRQALLEVVTNRYEELENLA